MTNRIFLKVTVFCVLIVTGCSSAPRTYDFNGPVVSYKRDRYIQASWARLSVQEVWERCMGEVQSFRYINHYLCMKANGYEEM
jgi:hypothetical protein